MMTIWNARWAIANSCAFIFCVPWLQGLYRWCLIQGHLFRQSVPQALLRGSWGDIFCNTKAKIYVLFIFVIFFKIFSMPSWIILGFCFALQLINGCLLPSDEVRVAYWAYIGRFVAALLLCWPLFQR